MSDSGLDEVARLAIVSACAELIGRFAWLNDQHRHEELAGLFTRDGSFARPTAPDDPVIGAQAILAFFRDRPRRIQRHLVSNILVTPRSNTTADARSAVLLITAPAGAAEATPVATEALVGEFEDELVLEAAGWRFRHRRGRVTLRWPTPAHLIPTP